MNEIPQDDIDKLKRKIDPINYFISLYTTKQILINVKQSPH